MSAGGTKKGPHIIAFDAGGTAVKAALCDEGGRECAVAAVAMPPLHPAPGFLERDPEAEDGGRDHDARSRPD